MLFFPCIGILNITFSWSATSHLEKVGKIDCAISSADAPPRGSPLGQRDPRSESGWGSP